MEGAEIAAVQRRRRRQRLQRRHGRHELAVHGERERAHRIPQLPLDAHALLAEELLDHEAREERDRKTATSTSVTISVRSLMAGPASSVAPVGDDAGGGPLV